jgi:hypothetical protein
MDLKPQSTAGQNALKDYSVLNAERSNVCQHVLIFGVPLCCFGAPLGPDLGQLHCQRHQNHGRAEQNAGAGSTAPKGRGRQCASAKQHEEKTEGPSALERKAK